MRNSSRLAPIFVLSASVMALGVALVAQYAFGLEPCNLCLIQRVPFVLAALLAVACLRPAASARTTKSLMTLAGSILAVNAAIAFYHVGVEQHWWVSAVCQAAAQTQMSVADLLADINKPVEASCDTPAWEFHGITMAALNIPFSLALGFITLTLAAGRTR